MLTFLIESEAQMLHLGKCLSNCASDSLLFYLNGELGTGKTTLVRGFIQACGHLGAVTSPTFTLVEVYEELMPPVYHFDLYRLKSIDELEAIAFWDYYHQTSKVLVEWPSSVGAAMPEPDWQADLLLQGDKRQVTLTAKTANGQFALQTLQCDGFS